MLSNPALAEPSATERARALLTGHDAAGAYALLDPLEATLAGDPGFDLTFGLAALDSGHVTRAIFALERFLALDPGNQPARAELARAYLAAGESDNARAEFARIHRAEVPAEAAAAIDRVLGMLDQIAPAPGPRFSGYLEVGGGWDSNVNSANNAGQFAIPSFGGLLFTVAPGSQRQHDQFASAGGGASAQVALSPQWSLLAGVNVRGAFNRHVHDMNTEVADGTAGISHAEGVNVQTVAFQSNTAWVSSSVYRTANGASAQWQSQIDAASQVSAFAQWSRQEYSGQSERNTDRSVLGAAYAHTFGATGTLAYGSFYGADEHARADGFDYFGHRAIGLRVGAEQTLSATATAFAEWQGEHRRYGGSEPLFDHQRHDRQNDLIVGLRFAPAPHWQLTPQIHYTRAGSDVALYDYSRTVVQLTLRREFQ